MRLLTKFALCTIATLTLSAETTMCFKENHSSISTIESISLDGGLCKSSKSVMDMKNEGWTIDDLKIESSSNGKNYIYIFKKNIPTLSNINEEKLEQKILARLEKRKTQEKEARKIKLYSQKSNSGKNYYIKKCQKCHGIEGKEEYGTSRAINNLSFYDFKTTIRDYNLYQYDRGQAFVMYPFANGMDNNDIKNVYIYLQSLKAENKGKKTIEIDEKE